MMNLAEKIDQRRMAQKLQRAAEQAYSPLKLKSPVNQGISLFSVDQKNGIEIGSTIVTDIKSPTNLRSRSQLQPIAAPLPTLNLKQVNKKKTQLRESMMERIKGTDSSLKSYMANLRNSHNLTTIRKSEKESERVSQTDIKQKMKELAEDSIVLSGISGVDTAAYTIKKGMCMTMGHPSTTHKNNSDRQNYFDAMSASPTTPPFSATLNFAPRSATTTPYNDSCMSTITQKHYNADQRHQVRQTTGLTQARLLDSKHNAMKSIGDRNEINLQRENAGRRMDSLNSQLSSIENQQQQTYARTAKSAATNKRQQKMVQGLAKLDTQYVEEAGNKFDFIKNNAAEKRRSSVGSECHWEPIKTKAGLREAVAQIAPSHVGIFKRQLNGHEVSVVVQNPNHNGGIVRGIQGHPFVKNEGYNRRQKSYEKKAKQKFVEQWLSKGVTGEEEDSQPAYLREKIVEFDATKIFDEWHTKGYQMWGGTNMRDKLAVQKLKEETKGLSKSKKSPSKKKQEVSLRQVVKHQKLHGPDCQLIDQYLHDDVERFKRYERLAMTNDQILEELYTDFMENFIKTERNKTKIDVLRERNYISAQANYKEKDIEEHFAPENVALRRLIYSKKDVDSKKYKSPAMVSINMPKNQKFLVQKIEGNGKLVTSSQSYDLLQNLVELYKQEDQGQKRRFQQLFKKAMQRKTTRESMEPDEIKKIGDPLEAYTLQGTDLETQDQPYERPFLKKALRDICQKFDLPIDAKSDEVFTEHVRSELTGDLSEDSLMSYRSSVCSEEHEKHIAEKTNDEKIKALINAAEDDKAHHSISTCQHNQKMILIKEQLDLVARCKKIHKRTEDVTVNKNHHIFEKEGKSQQFYKLIKDLNNKQDQITSAMKGGCPPASFFASCRQQMIVPQPYFSKVDTNGGRFVLTDFLVSNEMAKALEQYFKHEQVQEQIIKEAHFDKNGMSDQGLACVLNGLATGEKNQIEKLVIHNNELGHETIKVLNTSYFENLQTFCVGNIKIFPDNRKFLLEKISDKATNLKSLSLKGIDLKHPSEAFGYLIDFLESKQNYSDLRSLNLGATNLPTKMLLKLMTVILESKRNELTDLNLSYNALNVNREKEDSLKFMEVLATFIRTSRTITHLDLSGMQLGDQILTILPEIQKSSSLKVVHLSNNLLTKETKRFIFNTVMCDFATAKREQKPGYPVEVISNKDNYQESNTSHLRAINHQTMKQVTQNVRKGQTEVRNNYAGNEDDAFTFVRNTQPEVESNINDSWKKQANSGEWKVSLRSECWICDKWNFALLFFNQKSPIEHMEMIFQPDTIKELNSKIFAQKRNLQGDKDSTKIPRLTGSISQWRCNTMTPLKQFCKQVNNINRQFESRMNKKQSFMGAALKRSLKVKVDTEQKDFATALLDEIKKTVPCAQNAQVLNWPEGTTVDDVEKDLIWVWLGFVKPGTHSIIVKDPLDRFFTQTLNVDSRKDHQDLSGMGRAKDHYQSGDELPEEKVSLWGNSPSMPSCFENWKQDTYESLLKAFTIEQKFYMIKRNLKGTSAGQPRKVQEVIWQNYQTIKNVFIEMAASSQLYPGVCQKKLNKLFTKMQIKGMDNFSLKILFMIANDQESGALTDVTQDPEQLAKQKENQPKHSNNSDDQLRRFEFTDLLVMCAKKLAIKERKSIDMDNDLALDVASSLQYLVGEMARYKPRMEWKQFREEVLWTKKVNAFLSQQTNYLARFYRDFCELQSGKQIFPLYKIQDHFKKISEIRLRKNNDTDYQLIISPADVQYCFGLSKMTIIDDNIQEGQYFKLKFVEMFEFFARVAVIAQLIEKSKKATNDEPEEKSEFDENQDTISLSVKQIDHMEKKPQNLSEADGLLLSLQTLFEFLREVYQ